MEGPRDSTERIDTAHAALAARLRRIHRIAIVAAVFWVAVTLLCTVWVSSRIISNRLAQAAQENEREGKAVAGVVDRVFHELAAIPQVMSRNKELRAVVDRYNARGRAFADLPELQRIQQLKNDSDAASVSRRLALVASELNYDLVFAATASGILVVSSDWERPVSFLGIRVGDREYFQQALTATTGQWFAIARVTKGPVFFFSAAIEEDRGSTGVVVLRQTTESVGSWLASSQHTTLIVDKAGMVMASSRPEFALRHLGALADTKPDAATLREVYGQETLRGLATRPAHPLHEAAWIIDEHPYLVTRLALTVPDYSLLVLSSIDWVERDLIPQYLIGALAALFGVLVALLGDRRASSLARRRHDEIVTAALNEKLTALNAEKDRYLGIAAHDLRNPLSSVRGLSELMLETALEPPQEREFLEAIHRTSDEMLGLVNDLLDVSLIESGKLELRRSEQDVSKLVQRRVRLLEPYARTKKIELKLAADGVQRASIDAARYGQVVDNLVGNAIKFSPPGTEVRVALRSTDGSIAFSVQDQGPGIPEADRKLLFRSFRKLSARPTGGEKSTGLGLAIVKKIVDAHGGSIDVASAPGGGARFTVTTPSTAAGA